jgi:hypothetical protein
MEKMESACVLVEKPEEKRLECIWENIKMDNKEIRCGDMDWIHAVQYRVQWQALVNAVMKFRFS